MHSIRIAMIILALISCESLQAQTAPSTQPGMVSRAQRDALIAKARQRMTKDRQKYSSAQLAECEQLYQVANKNWRSDEAVAALNKMIEKYPDTNRTGCGSLYLAQYSSGEEQQRRRPAHRAFAAREHRFSSYPAQDVSAPSRTFVTSLFDYDGRGHHTAGQTRRDLKNTHTL